MMAQCIISVRVESVKLREEQKDCLIQ